MRLSCLTLNLKGLEDWHDDRDQLALTALRQIHADVFCLQEVVIQQVPFAYDQMDFLAEARPWDYRFFCPYGNDLDASGYSRKGLAILSRWPIMRAEMRCLPPGGPQDRRAALFAQIQGPSGSLQIINTHLSWEPEKTLIRLAQMQVLLTCCHPGPLLLAGDMNAGEEEAAIRAARDVLIDSYRALHPDDSGFTWIKQNPRVGGSDKYLGDRRVDYIFCDRTAQVHQAAIVLDQPQYVSDHFGIWSDIEWHL